MKLTIILTLFCAIQLPAFVPMHGQVTLKMQNESSRDVFKEVENQSPYKFFYNEAFADLNKRISINVDGKDINSTLDELLLMSDMSDKVMDNNLVVIAPRKELQQREVTGRVTDAATGEPLPGASIVIQGTTTGAISGVDGSYSLVVPDRDAVLEFSFVGYLSQEILVGDNNEINVALEVDVIGIDEVVAVGYGIVQKSDLTGAVSSVRGDMLNIGSQASLNQVIQGRIPGVQVTQTSAAPGGGFSVRIRGTRSITAGNEPLYVVDGVAGANPLNSLNAADIQSIEVLKDASSTAIYGSRGANGVVLITTRQGQRGTPLEVNYNVSVGFQDIVKKLDLMNAQEYMTFYNELSVDRGQNLIWTQEEMNAIGDGTNWQDEIFRSSSPIQEHRLSFRGGSEDTQYYLSLNYYDQDGIVINTGFGRISGRVNLTHTLHDRLNFGLNLNNSWERDTTVPLGTGVNRWAGVIATAIQLPPTEPVRNEDGSFFQSNQDLSNSVAQARTIDNDGEIRRLVGNVFADYSFSDNLKSRVSLGIDQRNSIREIFWNNQTQRGLLSEGQASKNYNESGNFLFEFTTDYNRLFRGNQSVNIVGGYSFQRFKNSGFGGAGQNFPTMAFRANNLGASEPATRLVNSSRSENTLLSGFSRLNYNYDHRYLLTATFRADGSSRFGEQNKYAYFPSGALAWRISNESFFPDNNFFSAFSELKIRGSYGISGNQEIGNARSLILLGTGPIAVFNGEEVISIAPTQLANPDLKWETTSQMDIGLDFGLFENRITGSIDYYKSNTNDLLLALPIPTTSGFSSSLQNVGNTSNQGFEFMINSRNFVGEFIWTTNFNLATLKNKVTNLGELPRILQGGNRFISNFTLLNEGDPMNSYYGYLVDGIFQSEQEISESAQPNARPGDRKFKDLFEDGEINADDRTILGDPFPDLTIGLNNNFGYRGFTLDLFLEGRFGFELANFTRLDSENPVDNLRNRERYVLNRWTPENPTNDNPSYISPRRAFDFNDRIVEDASFLRLKNVRLGYYFQNLTWAGNTSMSVYVSAQNLFTITNYSGYNPDVNVLGSSNVRIDYNAYPVARVYTLGINIKI